MGVRQMHGIKALSQALAAVENKRKGITGDSEKIKEQLKVIMAAVENPVPDRELPEDE